jgi:hypothetical protein
MPVKDYLLMGLLGLMGGIGYQVFIESESINNSHLLDVHTDSIFKDRVIFNALVRLQSFQKFNEIAFRKAVDCIDRLVASSLETPDSKDPKALSRIRGHAYKDFSVSTSSLDTMLASVKASGNVKNLVEVHSLYTKINERTKVHWQQVLALTK